MKSVVYLYASLALSGTVLVAQAQQPAGNAIERQAPHVGPKTETADGPSSKKQVPKGSEPSSAPLNKFVPKEKIPADRAIAFPVDI